MINPPQKVFIIVISVILLLLVLTFGYFMSDFYLSGNGLCWTYPNTFSMNTTSVQNVISRCLQ